MDKITIEVENLGKVSDGYHTIDELYDHRCILWISFCLTRPRDCYLKLDHYDGWFLLGLHKVSGVQVSYHCPNKYLDYVCDKIDVDNDVVWDGHTSKDVLLRLERVVS